MRLIDFFYVVAFSVLLGWLVLGSVVDVEYRGGSPADEITAASPPADTAWLPQPRPEPVATATVDEQEFWIFVGGSPKLYSVAISEDD